MSRLALVMIARNEAAVIARALKSAAGAVDQMIVLDTGSTDDTPRIAAALGAQVHSFAWCDDFSAARNASLSQSTADWNLVLDADEWLDGDSAGLDATNLPRAPRNDFLGLVQINHLADDGSSLRAWNARILPRGVGYEGRIHEQPASALPGVRLPVKLIHDGFLAERRTRKAGRNEALLLADIAASPVDGYLWYQLGREHDVAGKPTQAALCYTNALRLTAPDAAFRHRLVVRAITALKDADRLNDAVRLVSAEFDHWRESPDFFFAMGDLHLELAIRDPAAALGRHLPIAEQAWKRCLEIGERDDLDGSIAGRGSHMAAYNLAVCYETLGETQRAVEYQALAQRLRAA